MIVNRPTKMYVHLNAIEHNLKEIKKILKPDTKIMAVIKAAGYGSGAVNIINILVENGVSHLAVAIPEEGIQLREQGVSVPILIFTQPFEEQMKDFLKYDLISSISDYEIVKKLNEISQDAEKIAKVHIEVDTGMGRMGVGFREALEFVINVQRFKNIKIEGIYTHFACSDNDKVYTELQIERFETVIKGLKKKGIEIPLKHACNSSAIIFYPEAHYDMVRPGLILYGYYPNQALINKINLKPSLELKSKVAFIREVPLGTPISYNGTFITKKASKIVSVPIGYADGYRRELSNKGHVLIKGKRAAIVGKICMDMFMVDATDIPDVKIGDEVTLFDAENITVDEIAKLCGTINYEIMSTVGNRVPRMYME